MSLSADHLLAVAQTYWRADKADPSRADSSPEHQRLGKLWEKELQKLDRWWAFLDELRQELPEFTMGDATATPDACFRCAAYSPRTDDPSVVNRFIVVGCVSILAPVYTVYGVEYARSDTRRRQATIRFTPLPPEMRHPAEVIAKRIEATFQVTALPREVAETPIPLYVEPRQPPETTLFHALFTSEPASLP
jgi:hypothetical protein